MFQRSGEKKGASQLAANQLVAYFCAEYAISDNLAIYSGGLGVLAGDIVQEAAERKLSFVAIGLFYKKGFFHQYVDQDGQKEYVQEIDPRKVPLELMKNDKGETLLIEVPLNEHTLFVQVWRYMVRDASLYL